MIDRTPPIHRGGCLCGAVRYEATGQPVVVAHCHCEDCQRGGGAGHSTGAMFPRDKFHLTGHVAEFTHTSELGTAVTKTFCPVCGSPILGRNSGTGEYVTIAVGTIDDSSGLKPQVVIFARNRKPWDAMDVSLPTFESQPDWKPEDGV